MTDHPTILPLRQLLTAGFPRSHVVAETERHMVALQALSPEVEGRKEAIQATEQFLAEIKAIPEQ